MILTEKQQEAVTAYEQANHNETEAARVLGIDPKSLRNRLWTAAKSGWVVEPNRFIEQAPVGFGLTKSTLQINGDGEVVQRWDRVSPILSEITQEYFNQRIPAALPPPDITGYDENTMAEYLVMDPHCGMYVWGRECGEDYDLDIHRRLYTAAASRAFSITGPVHTMVIVLGGDNLHADDNRNRTEKSGHVLFSDSRHYKVADVFVETATSSIDCALQWAQNVIVIVLKGNHDPNSSDLISLVLKAHYRNSPRVTVNDSPEKHKFLAWGSNFFCYTHGDTGKGRLAPFAMWRAMKEGNPDIRWVRVQQGHLHKRGKETPPGLTEGYGVILERFPTLAPSGNYETDEAFMSAKAVVIQTHHKKYGLSGRREIGPHELVDYCKEVA